MKNLQKGFVIPIIIAIVALLTLGGGAYIYTNTKIEAPVGLPEVIDNMPTTTVDNNIVGGDKDEHGCIGSAGYSWCAVKNKCLRVWEEKCENTPINSGPGDKDGLVACTMDALQCPDGSYVGRSGPKCEFVCPSVITEKAGGIIKSIYSKDGKNYLDIDYVEFIKQENGIPGVNNSNSKIRTFEISNDIKIIVNNTNPDKDSDERAPTVVITFSDFKDIFTSFDYVNGIKVINDYRASNPWDIIISNGLIIQIIEHYVS